MRIPPTRGKRLQGATVARHRGCCWSTSKSTRIPSCRWARLTEVPGTSYCLVDDAARTGGASGLLPPHLASFGPFRFARRHTNRRNMSHRQDSRFTIRLRIPIASTPLLGGDGARAVAPVVDVRSGSGTNRETFEASNSLRCLLSLNGATPIRSLCLQDKCDTVTPQPGCILRPCSRCFLLSRLPPTIRLHRRE